MIEGWEIKRRNDDASRKGRTGGGRGRCPGKYRVKYMKDYYMYKYMGETSRRANVIKEVMLSC